MSVKFKPFSLKDRLKSFIPAFKGLKNLINNEHNSRIHLFVTMIVTAMGVYFNLSIIEWGFLVIVIGLVFLAELFNTALERLSDKVEPNWDNEIGEIKDYASAAVLVASFIALIVGGVIFMPKIITLDF